MTERGILFSAPMVRALLDGTKTQTRRALKRQPWASCSIEEGGKGELPFVYSALHGAGPGHDVEESRIPCICPYGQPGDRLWVRETFYAFGRWETRYSAKKKRDEWHFVDMTTEYDRLYQFDTKHMTPSNCRGAMPAWYKRPSIHMPRQASRILLEVISVRVERLQDISDQDAIAEGIGLNPSAAGIYLTGAAETLPHAAYRSLWESINGAGSWDANPWVWVVEFKRLETA